MTAGYKAGVIQEKLTEEPLDVGIDLGYNVDGRMAFTHLKSNEERGQEYMMLMTYGAEQRAAGKYIGFVEQIRRWYEKKSAMPLKEAADYAGITTSQFESVLSLIQGHPDWDDAEIADKASWR